MITSILADYAKSTEREFATERSNTIGASEIGACLRKTWFAKNGIAHDEGYVDRYGAKLRGTLIEDHYWEPGIRWATLQNGSPLMLHLAGKEQKTIVDGYISATPDGALAGLARDALAHLGVPDIGPSGCIAIECKSLDPRAELRGVARSHHVFQTQIQMGLLRAHTKFKPDFALITYVDASFLDEVQEFAVAFDPAVYAAGVERSRAIMSAGDPLELSPEGKISGGAECRYCPWAWHCAKVIVAGIPREEGKALGDNAMATLKELRDSERAVSAEIDALNAKHGTLKQEIKEFLRANHVRRAGGEGWEISWSQTKGRESVDTKAMEASGLDLTPWRKVGEPGDRLVVK